MKILVTGGAGYIGSVTTELLLDRHYETVVFDNLEKGHREAVDKRARFIKGDLRDPDAVNSAVSDVRPDAVIHFAAYALVGESMENPGLYFRNNVCGGVNLADAMLKFDVEKIVFSSTCAVYGHPPAVPITEQMPRKPVNPYGESKLMFENILRWQASLRGLKAVFLRYFNACGATDKFGEDHDPETHLIPLVLRVALGLSEKASVFGKDYDTPDGTCVRDFIHIVDLARAHILALESDASGAFNLGCGKGHSVLEVINTARRVTGRSIPSETRERRPGDPPELVAAPDKARKAFNWEPEKSGLEEIIRTAWDWAREHPAGYGGQG
ncbi:MAG: UDP-glucose 4-epimerase GalE [Kiritimatiellia bacterium]